MSVTLAAAILLVDKPVGPTSARVVAIAQRALGVSKAGHAGTLDPMASGLLVLCLGEATKVAGLLLVDDKEYEAVARLGVTTTTYDAEGEVTSTRDARHLDDPAIAAALAAFQGPQKQRPPMYSAVHQNGKRLHELARAGIEVEREPRSITIHAIDLLGVRREGDTVDVRFRVACSKGTYIRSLAADLGERLGVGAHLVSLRRTRAGRLDVAHAVPLDRVTEAASRPGCLLDPAVALEPMPALTAGPGDALKLRQGKAVPLANLVSHLAPMGEPGALGADVRVLWPDGRLLALAEVRQAAGEAVVHASRVFNYGLTADPS
jgi:tRNA pseudouridine55 synthase